MTIFGHLATLKMVATLSLKTAALSQPKGRRTKNELSIFTCVAPASSFIWGSRKDSKVASPQKQMKLSTKGMKMVGF